MVTTVSLEARLSMDDRQLERYSRQLIVPNFDLEGQEALAAARVVIVGCGGLGTPVALYLAAAGVGRLVLIDDDRVALSNLPRQVAFIEADIGKYKTEVLAARLCAMNPDIDISYQSLRLSSTNAEQLLCDADLVIDATDNREARLVIDAATVKAGMPWLMGAAVQTSGQNLAFSGNRAEGCYHCLSPESPGGVAGSCKELGILGPVVGSIAMTQALDAIKYLTGCGAIAWGALRISDFLRDERYELTLSKRPDCPVCGTQPIGN